MISLNTLLVLGGKLYFLTEDLTKVSSSQAFKS